VLVEPTPAGREGIEAIYSPVGSAGMDLLARYSDADLRLLHEFLREGYRLQVEQARRLRTTAGAAASTERDAVEPVDRH
jgi:hypothetical protein